MDTHQRLQIIIGPMQSGKSTELHRRLSRYMSYMENVLVINSIIDDREELNVLSTHDTSVVKKMPAIKVKSLLELRGTDQYLDSRVIGIDEAQFFDDLTHFVVQAMMDNKVVIVSGLDATAEARSFGQILGLIPLANDVIKLTACCGLCKDGTAASYSHCMIAEKNGDILVGGSEKYIPLCFEHYTKLNPNALESFL